jgi:homoserine kinase type II
MEPSVSFSELFLTRCARHFLGPQWEPFSFTKTAGGINNFVYYCDTNGGATHAADNEHNNINSSPPTRFVLRIYNNGGKLDRIEFEHKVLSALATRASAMNFRVPELIPCLATVTDSNVASDNPCERRTTYSIVEGHQIAVFQLIPGINPEISHVYEFGLAAGQLASVLAEVTPMIVPELEPINTQPDTERRKKTTAIEAIASRLPTIPLYDLFEVHDAVDKDSFVQTINSSAFDEVRTEAIYLRDAVLQLETVLVCMRTLNLPYQVIHGDLVYNNVLIDGASGKVTGLIDFEFSTLDWRAIDLAICLSKYAHHDSNVKMFDSFFAGYVVHGPRLSVTEMHCIPQLIALRLLSNVVYFVGRIISGEDSVHTLTERMGAYVHRLEFIRNQSEGIIAMCKKHFKVC